MTSGNSGGRGDRARSRGRSRRARLPARGCGWRARDRRRPARRWWVATWLVSAFGSACVRKLRSIRLNAGGDDDLLPALAVGGDVAAGGGQIAGGNRGLHLVEARDHILFRQHVGDRLVELREHGRGRLRRRRQHVPRVRDDVGVAKLAHRRHAGERVDAILGADRQDLHAPGFVQVVEGRVLDEGEIDVPRDQIIEHGIGALVRHMGHLRSGDQFEQFGGEVGGGPGSVRGIVQRAGMRLHVCEEFLEIVRRKVSAHHERQRHLRQHRHRLEPGRIVVEVLEQKIVDRHCGAG